MNPWPDDLTRDQVAEAQAALASYSAYWSVLDDIAANPAKDWTSALDAVAIGSIRDKMLSQAKQQASVGARAIGDTTLDAVVTNVEPSLVTISACIDKSNADVVDANGVSVRAPDAPGSYWRYASTAEVGLFVDGRWLVSIVESDRSTTC